ncbi:hypothetical protein [Bacteroides acidifaciens]|uniref:hypothetical protein n=1 Tax=Bacteroides acidifaciens TaxID=85831 RepID=UPI0026ED5C4A|nr:hypothetical protein [Bacteroides acidifaciens]
MELFDYDYLNGTASKYDTNHIHMYIEGDISRSISELSNVDMGKFVHEYVHYLQHIMTLFGLNICTAFARASILFIEYCRNKAEIILPIDLSTICSPMADYIAYFNRVKGDKTARCAVDDIEIVTQNIAKARKNKSAVEIGAYDYDYNVALESAFKFGYTCVIETMAHIIQTRINPIVQHDIVPYLSGIKIFEYITGRKVTTEQDENLIVTLCYGALQHDNPGVAFIEGAYVIKDDSITDWHVLYKRIMNNIVVIEGNKFSLKQMLINFLDRYKKYLQISIGNDLQYYNKVIENIQIEVANDRNLFLEMFFSGEIFNRELFENKLTNYYGLPFVESDKIHIFPKNLDTATLRSLEILIIRFQCGKSNTICPWYKSCSKENQEELSKISIECKENQWDKTEKCLFTEALRYFRLSDKTIIQN